MGAKVFPERRLNLGFRTQKKCPFNTGNKYKDYVSIFPRPNFVSSQWLCPLNRGVRKEGFQCSLSYYRTCCLPIRGLWRKLFSENIFLSTTMATLREEASGRYEEAGVICHYFFRGEAKQWKNKNKQKHNLTWLFHT